MVETIKNDKQYEDALESVYLLMQKNIKPGSKESDQLENLSTLIKEYETNTIELKAINATMPPKNHSTP